MDNLKGKWVFLLFLIFFVLLSIMTCGKKEQHESLQSDLYRSSQILREAADEYWNQRLEEYNSLKLKLGLKVEKLPDLSYAHAQALATRAQALVDKLGEIDAEELDHEEWLSWEILKWHLNNAVAGQKYYWFNFPVSPYSSPIQGVHRVFTEFQFESKEDCDHYMNLLRQYPTFINGLQDKLQGQDERNIRLPKEEFGLVIPFLSSFIKETDQSVFYVKDERLAQVEVQGTKDFQIELRETIAAEINPALESLVSYLEGDYAKNAPDQVGLWQYPGGLEYYTYLVKFYTTKDITPKEVHDIGLQHVKLSYEGIAKIKEEVGFEGSLDGFVHFLKTDKRFFPKTAEEIGDKLRSFIAGMDAKINQYFLRKPQAPYGTERLDSSLERTSTFGYYQGPTATNPRGIYYYNGSTPEERSLINSQTLIYHELVPGHHFHLALQSENEKLPEFRQVSGIGAFNEGWAVYASRLGKEMGLYKDPYDLCGLYLSDMTLSTRLVVDTGMNYFEWSRTKAAEYMTKNSFFTPTQIYTESFRYSAGGRPGQALAYKMGNIQMLELREKAEKALEDKFDIRKFHDAILGGGAMPFSILEKHIDWFIEKELADMN